MIRDTVIHKDTLSCEAIMRIAPNGDYLIVCQCGGTHEPAPENRVYLFRSRDGGKTWSEGVDIYPGERAVYQTEVSVYGNTIDIFMTVHNGVFLEWDNFILRSTDSGYTFTRVELPVPFGFVFVRGRLETAGGRILYPYHNYDIPADVCARLVKEGRPLWECGLERQDVGVLISDDGGKTFRRQDIAGIKPESNWLNNWEWAEPTVVEPVRGHLVMLIRRDKKGFLFRSDSFDGGDSWTPFMMTDIPNPSNKTKLLKNGRDGSVVLLHTPVEEAKSSERRPLAVWVSYDGMESWGKKIVVSDAKGQHAYPDGVISPDGRKVLFAYEFDRKDIHYVEVDL